MYLTKLSTRICTWDDDLATGGFQVCKSGYNQPLAIVLSSKKKNPELIVIDPKFTTPLPKSYAIIENGKEL